MSPGSARIPRRFIYIRSPGFVRLVHIRRFERVAIIPDLPTCLESDPSPKAQTTSASSCRRTPPRPLLRTTRPLALSPSSPRALAIWIIPAPLSCPQSLHFSLKCRQWTTLTLKWTYCRLRFHKNVLSKGLAIIDCVPYINSTFLCVQVPESLQCTSFQRGPLVVVFG